MTLHGAVTLILLTFSSSIFAQSYFKTDYIPSSTFKEKGGDEKLGSGDLMRISGAYTLPLSVKKNELNQITALSATLSGAYSSMDNKGLARTLNPREIFNTNLTLSYLRPINDKWSLIGALGAGIYSEPNDVSWKSVLVNGGLIFVYKINDKLGVGVGAGVTNSYGIPMAIPMVYLKYNLTGKYSITVDFALRLQVAGTVKFSDKFNLKLTAIEMDGISAVTELDGKKMVYSSMMMRSYLSPEYKLDKKSTLFAGIGGTWMRNSKLSERKLKSLWKSFSDDDKYTYKPTAYFTIGYKYGF